MLYPFMCSCIAISLCVRINNDDDDDEMMMFKYDENDVNSAWDEAAEIQQLHNFTLKLRQIISIVYSIDDVKIVNCSLFRNCMVVFLMV